MSNLFLRSALALVLIVTFGCQQQEQVNTYNLPRTSPANEPINAAEIKDQFDHILVAIVPQNDKAWFFKLVGKAPAIARQRQAFDDFLATVKLAGSSADTPTWELPEGWSEKEASAMRAATIVVPDESGELDLAVSSLPLSDDWEGFLIPNVNRWLGQLQREPLSKQTILKLEQTASTASGKASVFELAGLLSKRPMGSNPHEGLGIAPPPSSQATAPQTPPTQPPAAKQSGSLTYKKPEAWSQGAQSPMRKASFLLSGDSSAGQVAVTSFPAAPGTQMGDVGANVRRWAGQVGISELTSEQQDELTETITVSGIEGTYVELVCPPDAPRKVALFAAMVQLGEQVWFFKMTGNKDLVISQRDTFREFLGSVQLP